MEMHPSQLAILQRGEEQRRRLLLLRDGIGGRSGGSRAGNRHRRGAALAGVRLRSQSVPVQDLAAESRALAHSGSVRRRPKVGQASCLSGAGKTPALPSDETASTVTIERIPGPAIPEFGAEWDAAWEKNLLAQALERVRERIEERQFQVFDLNVMKAWPAKDVAQTLGISVARIYLTKQRVAAVLKKEGDW